MESLATDATAREQLLVLAVTPFVPGIEFLSQDVEHLYNIWSRDA
jgi:hypothetical protein